jgi:hypothetical protein
MKNAVFWDVAPRGSLRTDVSKEPSASMIRVTRISELGTTLALTSIRSAMIKKYYCDVFGRIPSLLCNTLVIYRQP